MKEYCKRCSLPLREWEWAGEGCCEVCDEYETRKGETMTTNQIYWMGFEDGYADQVSNEQRVSDNSSEQYSYRSGFRDGQKARDAT